MSVAAVAALCLTGFAAAPTDVNTAPESGARMYVKVDGRLVDLEDQFRESALDLDRVSEPPDPRSRLIDFTQWVRCYTFDQREDVFNLYTHYWDGVGHDVRLKCGEPGGGGWGYRHIEDEHKDDWQNKLDQARSKGWKSEVQGVHSWDDFMSGAAGSVIAWPEIVGVNAMNAKKCGITDLYLVDTDRPQVVLMIIKVLASWATDSDRLITVFPTSRSSC